jgi:hypothetical protein
MEHMETKDIRNYVIDLNKLIKSKSNTMNKVYNINLKP